MVKNPGSLIKGLEKAFTCGLKYEINFDRTNTHTMTPTSTLIQSHTYTHPQPLPHSFPQSQIHTHPFLTHMLSHTLMYTHILQHTHTHTFSYTRVLVVFSHTCTLTHTDTYTVMALPGSSLTSPQMPGTAPECWYAPVQGFLDLSLANSQDSPVCITFPR